MTIRSTVQAKLTAPVLAVEAWEFLQQSRAQVIEKPLTAQGLLRAVERVTT